MLAHAQEAIDLVKGRTLEDWKNNRILQLAHTRLIEVVEKPHPGFLDKHARNTPMFLATYCQYA
jgi:hypothetical protein